MPTLDLAWGLAGLRKAMHRHDSIVIIDELRFSSAVVAATYRGFTILPTADRSKGTEGFSLSPISFIGKKPCRVVLYSSNGASLSVNARYASRVIYGSLLNAKAVAASIDRYGVSTTLLAAGEKDITAREPFVSSREKRLAKGNRIFALEDIMAAGAIAYYAKMSKSQECIRAVRLFKAVKGGLSQALRDTASHRYNTALRKGTDHDTVDCSALNACNVVPYLLFNNRHLEIKSNTLSVGDR